MRLISKIKSKRKSLNNSIKKFGLNSKQVKKLSEEIDVLINQYLNETEIRAFSENSYAVEWYYYSYNKLKIYAVKLNRFPTVLEWNRYAVENTCLSSISMQYISMLSWNELKSKISLELNSDIL